MEGWIKIHREMMQWEWWGTPDMVAAYLTMLLLCAAKPCHWRGIEISAGEFVASRHSLSQKIGISEQRLRTVLKRLQKTGEITVRSNTQYTIIAVKKWGDYQVGCSLVDEDKSTKINQQINQDNNITTNDLQQNNANKQPASNQRATSEQPHSRSKEVENNINTLCAPACASSTIAIENDPEEKPSCLPFDAFWSMYGKKVDKAKCERKWAKLPEKDRAAIKDALPVYVGSTPELQYRKNPLSWLSGRCWEDEMQRQPDRNPSQCTTNANCGQVLHDYTFAENESGTGKADWEA